MPSVTQVVSAIGWLVVLKLVYDLLQLVAVYTLTSKVNRYLYGTAPYALVTGATDGIGKAVAQELYKLGFNLILHGRNPEKLESVRKEIQGSGPQKKDVKLWVADANSPDVDFNAAVAQWEGLEITLVVHNVGSTSPRVSTIDDVLEAELLDDVRRNALFPMCLSRALLPKLRRAAGPVEMVFCGSLAGSFPSPRLIPYGATKAFLHQFSPAIRSDELYSTSSASNITTLYMHVGGVVSASYKHPASFSTPVTDVFARHFVHCIGCGRSSVAPYWPHAAMLGLVAVLPESVLRPMLFSAMDEEVKAAKKA